MIQKASEAVTSPKSVYQMQYAKNPQAWTYHDAITAKSRRSSSLGCSETLGPRRRTNCMIINMVTMSSCQVFFGCNFVICDPDLHMLCPRWSGFLGYWTLFIHVVEFSRTLILEERAAYLHVPILNNLDWAVMLLGLYRRGGESGNDGLLMLTFSNKVTKLPSVLIYLAVFIRLCIFLFLFCAFKAGARIIHQSHFGDPSTEWWHI